MEIIIALKGMRATWNKGIIRKWLDPLMKIRSHALLLIKKITLLIKGREGKSRKRKKGKSILEVEGTPTKMVQKKLSEGLSPSKAVAGE